MVVNGCLYTQLTQLLRRGKPKINIYGGDIFICSTYHLPTIRKISQQRNPRFSFDFLFVSFLQSVFVGNNISWWMKHWTCYIWAGLSSKWVVSAGDQQREWESLHPSIDGFKKKIGKCSSHWIIIEHLAQGRMLIIRLPAQLTGMSISCHIFLQLEYKSNRGGAFKMNNLVIRPVFFSFSNSSTQRGWRTIQTGAGYISIKADMVPWKIIRRYQCVRNLTWGDASGSVWSHGWVCGMSGGQQLALSIYCTVQVQELIGQTNDRTWFR